MEELWYKDVTYEDAIELAKENLVNTVTSFIAAGYWLKHIKDGMKFKKDGYETIWECAEARLGLKKSEASRAMGMNDKYSIDGNTPFIQERYKQYNKSQLQEMLTMTEEQIEQVSPDMTIAAIRDVKNPMAAEPEVQSKKLEEFVQHMVTGEYLRLRRIYDKAAGFSIDDLMNCFGRIIHAIKCELDVVLEDDVCSLVDRDTGEILEKHNSALVMSILTDAFLEADKNKQEKVLPEIIKGLMDYPYCGICGAPLNSPDEDHVSEACRRCGQAVDWSRWSAFADNQSKEFVATSQEPVDTQSNEELQEEFLTEIEEEADQEELNVEFNTDELLDELDVIDAEYREVDETIEEPIATSQHQRTKPDSRQNKYLDAFARYFISCEHDWMIQDYQNRVLDVTRSPEEIMKHLSPQCRCWSFKFKDGIARINLFDDYVQVYGEYSNWIGDFDWFYLAAAIQRMWNVVSLDRTEKEVLSRDEKDSREETESDGDESDPKQVDEIAIVRSILEQEKETLNAYLELGDIPENTVYRQKMIVGALASMVCDLENMQEQEEAAAEVQPEFPKFRNDNERKAWISDVEAWGLWYEDGNIGAKYYKYDFPDGSRVIAVRYRYTCPPWIINKKDRELDGTYKNTYYHMIYSDAYKKINEYAYEKYYVNTTSSISELVKFIKEISKKG